MLISTITYDFIAFTFLVLIEICYGRGCNCAALRCSLPHSSEGRYPFGMYKIKGRSISHTPLR